MPSITVKNLPDWLYHALKERAEANRRSLNNEIVTCLESAVRFPNLDVAAELAEIRALRQALEKKGGKALSQKELDRARRRGRP